MLGVTLLLSMQVAHGTRVIIDQSQPATGPLVICFANGCMADYDENGWTGDTWIDSDEAKAARGKIRAAE